MSITESRLSNREVRNSLLCSTSLVDKNMIETSRRKINTPRPCDHLFFIIVEQIKNDGTVAMLLSFHLKYACVTIPYEWDTLHEGQH
jgi:hypothetical protein